MIEIFDDVSYEPARFYTDLQALARSRSTPFDGTLVRKSLDVFAKEIDRSVVQTKTTTKPGDGLYYRFFYKWENDLADIARRNDLLRHGTEPIDRLQREALDKFSDATQAGLDFETGRGLSKVWTFTGVRPVEDLFALSAIPDSVPAHAEFFARHGLRRVFFVASDFHGQTMNVYPVIEPECRNEEWLRGLVNETSGPLENAPDYGRMMASLAKTGCLGMTFSWDSPDLHRWALYSLNVPSEGRSDLLPELPRQLAEFEDRAPTLNARPQANIAWSFGRAGFYTKLEKSYAKDANYFLTTEMGCDLSR
ncbi:aromatic prenyltransferase [Streptomyces sp. NPDC057702]|uniref:aromatic prenyltransferase n=1 Tax=unclassified Streptomyces TaxID=2593676 RepID=UPI003689DB30